MKTPRQILLERHAPALPALDSIRQAVVAPLHPHPPSWKEFLWKELVLPMRPLLAGLAAAWVLILALHLSTLPASRTRAATPLPASLPREIADQQRILSVLLGLRPSTTTAPMAPSGGTPPSGRLHRRIPGTPSPA